MDVINNLSQNSLNPRKTTLSENLLPKEFFDNMLETLKLNLLQQNKKIVFDDDDLAKNNIGVGRSVNNVRFLFINFTVL